MDEPAPIEPGEPFEIEYGNGKRLQVVALNGRQRRECMLALDAAHKAGVANDFAAVADAIPMLEKAAQTCCPTLTDEDLEKFDEELLGQVIVSTLGKLRVTGEQAKKS